MVAMSISSIQHDVTRRTKSTSNLHSSEDMHKITLQPGVMYCENFYSLHLFYTCFSIIIVKFVWDWFSWKR